MGCIAWLVEQAFQGSPGHNYWWIAPVFPQADIAYRRIKQFLTPGSFSAFASPQPRVELISGGIIWIKSADNPDSLYGEDVYAAVLDEASRCKEESWHALRSTLTATRGPARLIGNVKGRKNFFYHLARQAEKGDLPDWQYAKITAYDAIQAKVLERSEIDDARRTLPENIFKELYLAEPGDDAGNPFGMDHIQACVGRMSDAPPVAFGIDIAKKQDYFVVIGLDQDGRVCVFGRWTGVPWRDSIRRVHRTVGEDIPALVDSTGVGDPVLEELQYEHGNFAGFHFSQVGKQKLMEGLAVSIQGHEISFPDGPIRQELDSFEYEYTKTGVRYTAPDGYFDDCVCALALAREQWSTQGAGVNLMGFYAQAAQRARREAQIREEQEEQEPFTLDFRSRSGVSTQPNEAGEALDNELTALYNRTLAQYMPEKQVCRRCGGDIAATRVSDGVYVWHPYCYG